MTGHLLGARRCAGTSGTMTIIMAGVSGLQEAVAVEHNRVTK